MAFSEFILNSRFGYGIRPGQRFAPSSAAMLNELRQPDPLDKRFKRPSMADRFALSREFRQARKDQRRNVSGAADRYKAARDKSRKWIAGDMQAFLARATVSDNGFRERLVAFWADHFTVAGKNMQTQMAVIPYVDAAIRPNIAGKFAEILKAVVTNPAMLIYLDQNSSIGPNSVRGKRGDRGLNENLAREVLELHTMGVGASYTQDDVRQFAELLTGLSLGKEGFRFDARAAEPGAETVLGKRYGGEKGRLADVMAFLDDLSVHPDTARHISRKLAVHFIAENPPADMVDLMTRAYRDTGGDLLAVYGAMLSHPAATAPSQQKIKWPTEFIVSSLRALNLGEVVSNAPVRELRAGVALPMVAMGMSLFRPSGPDGWSESPGDWITPPTLAARIEWATMIAREYAQDIDPRVLAPQVLGENISDDLAIAVAGAENKWEGAALLLASPEFNRR